MIHSFCQFIQSALKKGHTVDLAPLLSDRQINDLMTRSGYRLVNTPGMLNANQQMGDQPSNRIGGGIDFAERRSYNAGDDPRFIDWRASARSQEILYRNFYSEQQFQAGIVIDRQYSMAYGTRKRLKLTQAVRAGITIGARLLKGGLPLACLLTGDQPYWQPPHNRLSEFRKTIQQAVICPDPVASESSSTDWSRLSGCLVHRLAHGSRLILISDFLQMSDRDWQALKSLNRLYRLSIIQILDTTDQRLPWRSSLSLSCHGCDSITLSSRQDYRYFQDQLNSRRASQQEELSRNSWNFLTVLADDPIDTVRAMPL